MTSYDITNTILTHYPDIQAIYLFGSWGTEYEHPGGDLDVAVLLPASSAFKAGSLMMSVCQRGLVELSGRDVDLINLRRVNTVFQHEIIQTGSRILTQDLFAADSFEMLTMSLYQKLNEERAEILGEISRTGKVLGV